MMHTMNTMFKTILTACLLLALASCAGGPGGAGLQFNSTPRDQIEAEKRMMRNNLSLAMRENEVLKEENLRYKSEVTQLSDCVARLTSEIVDMDRIQKERVDEFENLFEQFRQRQAEIETDYCWTVDELRAANAAMEERTAARLEEMAVQFKNAEEGLQKALAAAKNELSEKIEESVRETANLDRLLAETRTALEELGARVENLSRTDDHVRSELEDIRRAIEDIRRKTADLDQSLQSIASSASAPSPTGTESVPGARETQGVQ